MINIFRNLKEKMNGFMVKKAIKKAEIIERTQSILVDNSGESESTGATVLIIGALVVGAVIIGLLLVFFRDSIWPLVTKAAQDLFNIK